MTQLRIHERPAIRRPRLLWPILRFLALLAIVLSIMVSVRSLTLLFPDPMFLQMLGP
jgi:hypothetical protein